MYFVISLFLLLSGPNKAGILINSKDIKDVETHIKNHDSFGNS